MNPMPSKLLLYFIIFFAATSSTFAQSSHEAMEKDILKLLDEYQAIGLSVAVVKDGDIIYTKSFGKQNIDSGVPLADDHIFRIASISKSFTATAIMQLIEAGKFNLDADFSDLVGFTVRNPNFPDKPITLRMVLSHTSSINDSQGYFNFDVIDPVKNPDWAKAFSNYEPGSKFQYCNLNYNMTGAVIERFSGLRFDQYIAQHILRPLGLYAGYEVDALDSAKFASIYTYGSSDGRWTEAKEAYNNRREELKHYTLGVSTPVLSPTGGMKISASDLARYMIMHMNYGLSNGARIIQESSSKEMQKASIDDSFYGFGLRTNTEYINGERMVGHAGDAYGLHSNMYFEPTKKFGVVLITNGFVPPMHGDAINIDLLQKTARVLYQNLISN